MAKSVRKKPIKAVHVHGVETVEDMRRIDPDIDIAQIPLSKRQRAALEAKAKACHMSFAEFVARLIRACADDELLGFVPESEIRAFIHLIDFGDD